MNRTVSSVWLERPTHNRQVVGSNPTRSIQKGNNKMNIRDLIDFMNNQLPFGEVVFYDVQTSTEYEPKLSEARIVEGDTLYIPMYPLEKDEE